MFKKLQLLAISLFFIGNASIGALNAQFRNTPDPRPISMQPILSMNSGPIPKKEFNVPNIPATITQSTDGNFYTVNTGKTITKGDNSATGILSVTYDKFGNYIGMQSDVSLDKKSDKCNIF